MSDEKRRKYYDTDPDKIQKALAEIGQGDYFKPKEGKNVIRILPPWSKKGLWYKEATLHYGLQSGGKTRGYVCLKQFDKDCPICEAREDLLKGDAEEKELADTLRPRTKYYANILDRATGRVMIWGFTPKTLGVLLGYEADPDHCNNKLSDPDEGFDVVIERTGTGRNDTRYNIRVKPKSSEIGDDSDWEDKMKDLDEVVEESDESKLQDILDEMLSSGGSKKKQHDQDDDDRHKKSKSEEEKDDEPRKKKPSSDENDDDESPKRKRDDADDDDDDDKSSTKRPKEEGRRDHSDDEPRKKAKDDDDDEAARRKRRRERRERRNK